MISGSVGVVTKKDDMGSAVIKSMIEMEIPTKNEEKSIGICIEKIQRVFNEHHIDGEIIVADNSTDNTPEIAKSMGAKTATTVSVEAITASPTSEDP